MPATQKNIGFFGGTFDPVHNGHLAIAKSFLDSGFIDSLWIFLNPSPPHKKKRHFAPFKQRLEMLEVAFKPMQHAFVTDLELSLPKPSYTVQTIAHLKKTYPHYTFYICIGKDSLLSFTNWYKWEELLNQTELLVADRPDETSRNPPKKIIRQTHFVDHEAVAISSSQIRKRIEKREPVSHMIPTAVLDVIKRDRLYT